MGLFDRLFGHAPTPAGKYQTVFTELNGYTPTFTTWNGELYESELVRAAINTLAIHISKLNVEVIGSAQPPLQNKLKHAPNEFQTWPQFLSRAATIYYMTNNVFFTPLLNQYGEMTGIFTPLPQRCSIVQYGKEPYLRYEFSNGTTASMELSKCGVMQRMQYKDDFFGESNRALDPTMELISMQNQGIEEGVKSAATYRFYGTISNFTKAEDLAKERQRFTEENFSKESKGGGLLLFPNTYKDIKQIDVKPWVVDAEQMRIIKDNVYQYFGVNEKILTNSFDSEIWAAFYEGAVEPWAILFSEVLTKMLFTLREQSTGNLVMASANRLQYMSNSDKLKVSAQMADRGLMTRNEIREIWNLAPLPEPLGSQIPARGEYYNVNEEAQDERDQSV